MERRSLHALRRSFASNLYARGAEVRIPSKLSGHAGVEIPCNRHIRFFEWEIGGILRQGVGEGTGEGRRAALLRWRTRPPSWSGEEFYRNCGSQSAFCLNISSTISRISRRDNTALVSGSKQMAR